MRRGRATHCSTLCCWSRSGGQDEDQRAVHWAVCSHTFAAQHRQHRRPRARAGYTTRKFGSRAAVCMPPWEECHARLAASPADGAPRRHPPDWGRDAWLVAGAAAGFPLRFGELRARRWRGHHTKRTASVEGTDLQRGQERARLRLCGRARKEILHCGLRLVGGDRTLVGHHGLHRLFDGRHAAARAPRRSPAPPGRRGRVRPHASHPLPGPAAPSPWPPRRRRRSTFLEEGGGLQFSHHTVPAYKISLSLPPCPLQYFPPLKVRGDTEGRRRVATVRPWRR